MTIWPIDLPQRAFLPVTEARQAAALRSTIEGGPVKTRRLFGAAVRTVGVSLLLTGAQRAVFDHFFSVTLEEGALRFDWVDPATGETVALRFREPPSYELLRTHRAPASRLWRVGVQLEVMPGIRPSAAGALLAAGQSAFEAAGAALAAARLEAAGGSSAVFVSAGPAASGTLTAAGSSAAAFAGGAKIPAAMTAQGAGAALFDGAALASAALTAAGTSDAEFVFAPPPSGFQQNAVVFNGTQGCGWSTSIAWQNTPSATESDILVYKRYKPESDFAVTFVSIDAAYFFLIDAANEQGMEFFQIFDSEPYIRRIFTLTHGQWHNLLFQIRRIDASTVEVLVYDGDTQIVSFIDQTTAAARTFNANQLPAWGFNFDSSDAFFEGEFAVLYVAPGQTLDITQASNRRRFFDASGNPVDNRAALGSNVPQPLVYFQLAPSMANGNAFYANYGDEDPDSVAGTLALTGDTITFVAPP